jgi:nucleoid DNA-binding protein
MLPMSQPQTQIKAPSPSGGSKLTKVKIVQMLTEVLDLPVGNKSRNLCWKVLNTILDTMVEALRRGEDVRIFGLGTFYLALKKTGRKKIFLDNKRQSPVLVFIPDKIRVDFKPADSLKAGLEGNPPNWKSRRSLAAQEKWRKIIEEEEKCILQPQTP